MGKGPFRTSRRRCPRVRGRWSGETTSPLRAICVVAGSRASSSIQLLGGGAGVGVTPGTASQAIGGTSRRRTFGPVPLVRCLREQSSESDFEVQLDKVFRSASTPRARGRRSASRRHGPGARSWHGVERASGDAADYAGDQRGTWRRVVLRLGQLV